MLSAAGGALAAAATIALLQSEPSPAGAERARSAPEPQAVASGVDPARLERIERELASLRERAAAQRTIVEVAAGPRGGGEVEPEAEDPSPPDPEAEYAEQEEMKEDWLRRHALEAVDTSWARRAEEDILLDLDRLEAVEWAGRDPVEFELVDVSCRSTLCVAAVEWDSARTAVEGGAFLAMHDYAQKCTVTVFGPSPEEIEADAPFVQEVFFDCAA